MASLGAMHGAAATGTFMGLPAWDGGAARAVLLGADGCTPYPSVGFYCAGAPRAVREAAVAFGPDRMNFDLGGVAIEGPVADGGDVAVREEDPEGNRRALRDAAARILDAGAVPVVLGGDDSIPSPVLMALEGRGPLTILQIDAHIDWRDEVGGERWGLSSTMRRASEMGHVERIVQVGSRGMGSARPGDAEAARAWGATLIPASAADPVAEALALIPEGARVAVCLDWDALDPSIMPAAIGRTWGGLGYGQVLRLIEGAASRGTVVAVTAAELMPSRDVDGMGAGCAAQLLAATLGILSRA